MPKNRRARLTGGLVVACLLALAACGGGGGSAGGSGDDAAGAVKNASPAPTGAVATKMQPQLNGWAFPNFPSATFPDINFDTADLVSMFGGGADVCVDGVADPCTLTAEAAAWARMVNQARATGHCEGLVALASARFNKAELPETVKLPSQEDEIRALMRAFATQFVPEVQAAIEKWTKASLADKVDELKRSFTSDKLEYTLGVYVEGGGHAVLPYAVEYPTPDVARIMVYDSNWPGRNRYVDVDLKAEKWTFSFAGDDPAADPNAWTGGSGDMDLTPFEAREGSCPFCGDGTKLQSTTLLVRTENLDWSVETEAGAVSPTSPTSGDGASARPVKGGVSVVRMAAPAGGRSSFDYVITIPNALLDGGSSGTTTSSGAKTPMKKRAKLNFGGASSVFAVMKSGVAQFTTPGGDQSAPVEIGTTSIKSNDPNVDLTLAAGNLVANASGSSVELGSTGGTLEVAVTTATGEVIEQQVTPEAPAVQVKADESGAVTVLQASATGEVKKTEVAADGTKTETVVDASALNLNKVEVELPPALASKPIEALPKLEERNLNNPNYKADEVYVPPTTVPAPRENAAGPTTTARGETPSTVQTRNAALPTTTAPRSVAAAGATPTTIAAVVRPTVTNFRIAAKTFGDDAFTLDPPDSNSPGGFRYTSSRPEVATVGLTTGRVTIVGAGSTTITATQAAVRGFEAATITATLTVAKAKPTIAETKDIVKTFGDDPFTVKDPASDSSGTITYASSNEDVVKQSKTSGRWVIGGAGRATITVTQASTDDHLAGTDSFVVTVRKGTPDVKAPADIAKSFLDADFDLPRPTSESKGAFTFTSSDSNVVSISGAKASIKSSGTVTITAAQAATDDWLAASTTFKVVVSSKAPTLTDFADITKAFGDEAFTLTAPKSNSTGAITYKSSDDKVVTVGESTGRVTVVAAGTATITATQAASGGFSAGTIAAKVTVDKADPSISDLLVADKEFGDADFTLKPTAKGAGKFTYSTDKTDVFNVDAETGVVKIVGVGTATLTAKLSSTPNYEAGSVSASVTVKKGTPTLTWSLDTKTYGDASFDLTPPTSKSAGKFTYSVSTADAVLTTVTEGGRVTIKKAGTVTIIAKQASTANWNEATTSATLTIDKAVPSIGTFTIPVKTYGDANFNLTAPMSNSPVAFEFGIVTGTSSEPNVAVVSSTGSVTLGSAGTVTIRAKQDGNENFTAGSVTATLTLNKAVQTPIGNPPFGLSPTNLSVATPTLLSLVGDSGLVGGVSYTVTDAGTAQCSVTKNEDTGEWSIVAPNPGSCSVRATKGGNRNFLPVSTAVITVNVGSSQIVSPSPAVVNWFTADENSAITMTAPPGQVVTNIDFASYGTPTGSNGAFQIDSQCHSSDSQLKVEQAFLGKSSATISANNGVFGDPCGGTYKRLFVKVTYGAGVVRQGLISYLDASKVSSYGVTPGVWTDISRSNTAVNATLANVTHDPAGYMEFPGNGYAHWGTPLATGSSYSIEGWIWRNTNSAENIASTYHSPFWFSNGTTLSAGIGQSYYRVNASISAIQVWMHVAVTFDDATNTMRLYRDGQQVAENTDVTAQFVNEVLMIGAHNNPDGSNPRYNFYGKIAEMRLYSRALNAAEVRGNYSETSKHCVVSSCQALALWIDAADTSTVELASGTTSVSMVRSRAKQGYDLSQATTSKRPVLSAESALRNGRRYLTFDGGDRLSSDPMSMSQPVTIFAVARNGLQTASNRHVVGNNSGGSPTLYMDGNGRWSVFAGSQQPSTLSADTSWHFISAVFNGGVSKLFVDGQLLSQSDPGYNGWSNVAFNIGNRFDDSTGWVGDIGEVMLFARDLTDEERVHTEKYLAGKWGFSQ